MAYYTYVRDLSTGGAVKLKSDKVWMLKEDDDEIVRQPFKYEDIIRDPDQPLAMTVGTKLHRICILEIDETQKGLSEKIAKRGPLGPCPQTDGDGTVAIDINAVKKKASKRHAKPASTSAKIPRKSVQSNKDAQSSDILRRVAHQGAEHPENKAPPKAIVVKEPVEATVVEHVAVQVHGSADCASKTDGRSEAYVRSSFMPLPKKNIQINTEFDRIDTAYDSDDSDSGMSPTSLIPKVSLLSSPANVMHIATAAKQVNVDVNHDPSENRLKINNKNEYHHFMVPHHEDSADPEVASLIAENQRLSEENILLKEQVRILIHNSASLTQAVQEINTNIANMSKSKNGLQNLSFAVDLEDEFASLLQLKKDDVYVGRGRVISRSALLKIEMKYLLFSQRAEKVFELISGGLDKFRLSATKGFQVFDDVDMEAVKNIVSLMYFPDDFKVTPKAMREFFQKQPFEATRRKKKAEDGKVVNGQETQQLSASRI